MRSTTDAVAVTIVVTPWQDFSHTKTALESIYAFTKPPFAVVYVDGNSPPHVQHYLQEQARIRDRFTLLRSDRYLTTSEAQNLALTSIHTDYVVFLENWTHVTAGWLDALVRCAEETNAGAVIPLYCAGDPKAPTVYSAAPDLDIIEEPGIRRLHETAPFAGVPLADVRARLERHHCGYAKSQCMLVRRELIHRVGGFDEGCTSYQGNRDFSLRLRAAGATMWFEPSAVVVLTGPPPLAWSDLPMFLLRWSDAWLRPSINYFARKWRISEDDSALLGSVRYRDVERRKLFYFTQAVAQRLFGWRGRRLADKSIDLIFQRLIEPTITARLERQRQRIAQAPPTALHPMVREGTP